MYIIIPLILPIIILLTGYLLKKYPPDEINSNVGYRTAMSEKNLETWYKGNRYSTKLLINFSWMSIILTLIISLILGKSFLIDEVFVSIYLIIISIIIIVILTEKHLKDTFEK